MTRLYTPAARALQDRFDTRRLADRLEERLLADGLGPEQQAFVERADMFFLATVDQDGLPQCSFKGGEPGFVRVLDARTIAFPSYDGNGMFLSLGNVAATARVGLLFVDFTAERPTRMRLNGEASVVVDDPLLPTWPEAQLVVRVRLSHVFPNCPRYLPRMRLVERSAFVPRAGVETPVPSWKRSEWARDVLPEGDPARDG